MKAIAHGPYSASWPDGRIFSPTPDETVEVDDTDEEKTTFLRGLAGAGLVTILEDAPPPPPAEPSLADLRARAEALGLVTYGSKAQLTERIANAEQEG